MHAVSLLVCFTKFSQTAITSLLLFNPLIHLALQLARALAYLHDIGLCVHGDVRADNILLTDNDLDVAYAKLTDLRPHRCLPPRRTAPSSGGHQQNLAESNGLPQAMRRAASIDMESVSHITYLHTITYSAAGEKDRPV